MRISIAGPALTLALWALAPHGVVAAPACSSDAFAIKTASLLVELCAPSAAEHASGHGPLTITESLTVKGQPPLARKVALDAALGGETSRTIDDAPLQGLGIAGTLHMTISYKNGAVRLEHALLVPGAIALK